MNVDAGTVSSSPETSEDGPVAATSRPTWLIELAVLSCALIAQAPVRLARLRDEVPPDLVERLDDPVMLERAVHVGAVVGFALYPVIFAVLLAVASLLERRVFGAALALPFAQRIGAFHLTVLLCLLPPAVVATGTGERPQGWVMVPYVIAVVIVVLALYRPAWRSLSRPRAVVVAGAILILAAVLSL